MRIRILAAAAALFCAAAAQADVVYNWQHVGDSPGIPAGGGDPIGRPRVTASSGRLVITDTAYQQGLVDYEYRFGFLAPPEICPAVVSGPRNPACFQDRNAPVRQFQFSAGGVDIDYDYRQGTGAMVLGAPSRFNLVLADSRITGSLYSDTGGDTVEMISDSASSPRWTLTLLASDGGLCNQPAACAGLAGRWVLDPSTRPGSVPMPGTLPLMALASFGAAVGLGCRRRARGD